MTNDEFFSRAPPQTAGIMKHETGPRPAVAHPIALWLLKAMFLALGLAALVPGINLMTDPSGKGIGFPEGALEGSPFSDYFIPGVLLTVCIGLLPLAAWWALWKKPGIAFLSRINPFPGKHWAWTLAFMSGVGLVVWIGVQMTMVPYFFLQPMLLAWGAGILLLCFMPGVRAFYEGEV